jgi:hypothetical protein
MGSLAEVVQFTRSVVDGDHAPEAKVDRGGGDTTTAGHFASPGDDTSPLPGDVVYLGDDAGKGTAQMLGYQDPKTTPLAGAGDKRIYARSGPGVAACEVWLKADGTVLVRNALGSIELAASGDVTVTTPLGSFGAATHTHATPFGPSGPPMPGT